MHILWEKGKEVLYAVLPVTVLVLILNWTVTPMAPIEIFRFLTGALMLTVGLSIFLMGVDIGITPIGSMMGKLIARRNKVITVLFAGLFLGFFISIAEPDLHILAGQVAFVTGGAIPKAVLVVTVSVGIAVLMAVGLVRIVYNVPLYVILAAVYGLILVLGIFTSPEFLAISFDASGATTGALTVPFLLAMAVGVSSLKRNSKASEKDSFGLVAIASTGAILAVMILNFFFSMGEVSANEAEIRTVGDGLLAPFLTALPVIAKEVLIALTPIVIVFLFFQWSSGALTRREFRVAIVGLIFSLVGLVLFLAGVNAGFMEMGRAVGSAVAALNKKSLLIGIGFALGFLTILAEPAVHVLTRQIEDVTSGYVSRKAVMATLSIAVGLAVALSMIRIMIPQVQLWQYLLPGYGVAVLLMFFSPKLFVGIAYDSGGVASGPMTATFILAFSQGVAGQTKGADVLTDGFGMIAMVALMPLITLQVLGLMFKQKSKKEGV